MRVRIGERTFEGRAVDLRGSDCRPERVVRAIRSGETVDTVAGSLAVACLQPAPVHERVGWLRAGMGLQVRTALAEAARTRGLTAPQDERRCAVGEELATLDVPDGPDTAVVRRREAEADTDIDALRERVATLRGRLAAAREAGRETDDLQQDLAAAARKLSERETERAAAREAVERAREQARTARDARERRRRLQDRRANLDRAARRHLVGEVRGEYIGAVAAAPGRDGPPVDPFAVDPVTAGLAVCRVADLHAPVVLACDRFESTRAAAGWLDTPVIGL